MAHFLTTDWTKKIKTNPVANMILNSHRPKLYDIKLYQLSHHPGPGKKISKRFFHKYKGSAVRDDTLTEERFKDNFETAYASFPQYEQSYNSAIDAAKGIVAGQGDENANDGDDVAVVAIRGGAGAGAGQGDENANENDNAAIVLDGEKKDDDDDGDAVEIDYDNDDVQPIYEVDERVGGDMWANVFVDDYINIHHPKLRYDYISALASKPLQIKQPSVFFSDV